MEAFGIIILIIVVIFVVIFRIDSIQNWWEGKKAKKQAKEEATKASERRAKESKIRKEKEKVNSEKQEANKKKLFNEFDCFNYPSQEVLIKYDIYYNLCLKVKGSMNGGFDLVNDYRISQGKYKPSSKIYHTNQIIPYLQEIIHNLEKYDSYYGSSDYYDFYFVKKRIEQLNEEEKAKHLTKIQIENLEKKEKTEERSRQNVIDKMQKYPYEHVKEPEIRITDKIEMGKPNNVITWLDSKYDFSWGFGNGVAVPYSFLPNYKELEAKYIPIFKAKLNKLNEEVNSMNDYNKLYNEVVDHIESSLKENNITKRSMLYNLFYDKQLSEGEVIYELKNPEIKAHHDKYHYLFANEATPKENDELDDEIKDIIEKHVLWDNKINLLLTKIYRTPQSLDVKTLNKYSNKIWTKEDLSMMPIKDYELLMEKTKNDNFKRELEEKSKERERKRKAYLGKKAELEKQCTIEEERRVKESIAGKLIAKSLSKLNDSCNYQGVYLIVNNKTLDFYIGESQNLAFRRLAHLGEMIDPKKDHPSTLMQKHFNQFGADTFDFYVLERIDDDTNDGKARKRIEAFYIIEYKPTYNTELSHRW